MQQTETVTGAEPIRNKVAESGIMTLDLAGLIPTHEQLAEFDLQPFLFMGMIVREKDYRAALQGFDWNNYQGKHTGIICSADAIVPVWAYMLAATWFQPVAASVHFAPLSELKSLATATAISELDLEEFRGKRVVLKGCGDVAIPEAAYVAAIARLRPVVKSLMYGEPCSTVPIYKQPAVK